MTCLQGLLMVPIGLNRQPQVFSLVFLYPLDASLYSFRLGCGEEKDISQHSLMYLIIVLAQVTELQLHIHSALLGEQYITFKLVFHVTFLKNKNFMQLLILTRNLHQWDPNWVVDVVVDLSKNTSHLYKLTGQVLVLLAPHVHSDKPWLKQEPLLCSDIVEPFAHFILFRYST